MPETDLQRLAAEAYVYGYPIAFNLGAVAQFTTSGYGVLPASAFNTFSHARQLAGPQDEFVSVNNDTVYSVSMLDLSVGPVLLHSPTPVGATTSCSSSTRGRTTSPTSAHGPPATRRARSC